MPRSPRSPHDDARRRGDAEPQPRLDYPPYRSSLLRHPTKDLHHADPEGIELCGAGLRPPRRRPRSRPT